MRYSDRVTVWGWADRYGWSVKASSRFAMFKRGTHIISVGWGEEFEVLPSGNIAFRVTGPDQAEPEFAQDLETLYTWFSCPSRRPLPPPPPPPAPPPVARFREMEF